MRFLISSLFILFGLYAQFIIKQSKQTEKKLRESESQLLAAHSVAHIGNWSWDIQTNKLKWSKENYRIFCLPPEVVPSYENFEKTIHPEDRDLVNKSVEDALKRKKPYNIEFRIVLPGNKESIVHAIGKVDYSKEGRPLSFYGTVQDITERKQADEALRESEEKYRLLIERMNDGLGVYDKNNENTYANDKFAQMLGFSKDEIIGRPASYFLDKTNQGILKEQIEKRKKGERGHYELVWTRKDGQKIYTIISPEPIFDSEGNFNGSFAVITDITERKRAEAEIVHEKERAEKYLSISEAIILCLDPTGVVTLINRRGCDVLGYEENEILGKNWFEMVIPTEQRDMVINIHNKVIAGEMELVEYFENEVITKAGERKYMLWNNTVEKTDDGTVIGSLSSGQDFTLQKQAEEAQQESEESFKALMHQSPAVIELYNIDGLQIEVNHAYEELWGFSAITTVNKFNVLKSKEVEDTGLMDYVKKAYAGESMKVPIYKFDPTGETEAKGKGRVRWLSTRIYPLKDKSGKVINIVITHEDVSEIKYAEEKRKELDSQLRQAHKMESIGTLAGGISHDFNNILSAILGNADMAIDDLPEQSPARYSIDQIIQAGHRARDLVKQILAFSRQTEHESKPVKVSLIVREALKLLRPSLPSTIKIRQRIIADRDVILADPTQIHQILMNLCTNVLHAMFIGGGVLEVQLSDMEFDAESAVYYEGLEPGSYIKLEVSDTGHGMNREVMDKIFDPKADCHA
ncbi:MAG: PAS domain S-box protein [Desulfobacterales bacterium]